MNIIPILTTLKRHRVAATLIILEIAFTCAIVSNSVYLISDRLDRMERPSGVVEDELIVIQMAGVGADNDPEVVTVQDLEALSKIPYVRSVSTSNMVPFGGSSWNSGVRLDPDSRHGTSVATYVGSENLVETLGVKIVAGRDFEPAEYHDLSKLDSGEAQLTEVLITTGLAEKLFPGENALGKSLYIWGKDPTRVVGLVGSLARPGGNYFATPEDSVIMPGRPAYNRAAYLIRVAPEDRGRALKDAVAALESVDANRIVYSEKTMSEIREAFFRGDRAMAWLLVGICIALLIVTALGIVGLASFWVQQRTKQIGVRRALGATRGDILRYFLSENFILATLGIVLGAAGSYGLSSLLMKFYELPRLPLHYLPIGAVALYLLCQLAVLWPAMRATRVPPAVATRGV